MKTPNTISKKDKEKKGDSNSEDTQNKNNNTDDVVPGSDEEGEIDQQDTTNNNGNSKVKIGNGAKPKIVEDRLSTQLPSVSQDEEESSETDLLEQILTDLTQKDDSERKISKLNKMVKPLQRIATI